MKIRIKRYIGFMLIFAMLSSNIVSAFGYESTALSDVNFSVNFIEKSSLQTQFENGTNETYNEFGTIHISGITNDMKIQIRYEKQEDITLRGKFYLFNTGAYAGQILGGQFSSSSDIELVTIKAETGFAAKAHYNSCSPVLCIKVKDAENKTKYLYAELNEEQFDTLKSMAEANATEYMRSTKSEIEYNDMVTALCFPFIYDGQKSTQKCSTIIDEEAELYNEASTATGSASEMNSFYDFTYDKLNSFITAVNSAGAFSEIHLSDFGIGSGVFEAKNIIRKYTMYDSVGWVSVYDSAEHDGFRYIVLSMLDFKFSNLRISSEFDQVGAQLEVKNSTYFEYVPGWGIIRPLSNMGVKLYNINMSISKLGGKTTDVFVKSSLGGIVNETSVNLLTLLGLVPKLSVLTTICSAFTTVKTSPFNVDPYIIGDTYEEQYQRYNGNVCRAIGFNSKGCYIKHIGDRISLHGTVRCDSAGRYQCALDFYIDGFIL